MTGVSTIAGLAPRRLLVRGVNWLGDAVMTTPALQRLHESLPQTHITLMTPDKLAGLWPNHPAVHDVLTFASSQSPLDVARTLRGRGFDAALILPNSFRSALELWLAGIPNRIGYGGQLRQLLLNYPIPRPLDRTPMRKRARREIIQLIGRGPGNAAGNRRPDATHAGQPGPGAHHIHHYLQLASCLGSSKNPLPPQLFVDPAEVQTISGRLGLDAQPSRPLFGLNPGAEYGPAKRWPVDRFIAVARRVQARADCRWVILGGKGDAKLAARVTAGILQGATPGRASDIAINLAGATSLRELCAVLKACRVLLTNDTGPMHVAAAVGTPVVVPFGSTSPELTGPGLPGDPRHRLLKGTAPCAPCFLRECPIDFRCMTNITVADVVQEVIAAGSQ